jgi:hypothetical protein
VAAIMPHSLPGVPRQASTAPATFRAELSDGRATTVHLAAYDLAQTQVRVVALPRAEQLAVWCARSGVAEALVGGFFLRDRELPLGELRLGGIQWDSVSFAAPWDAVRACVHIDGGRLAIARRPSLPATPRGDLLQAGPLLVEGGRIVVHDGIDPEGFSAGSAQFDSDITDGRHPRAALAVRDGIALSLTCDGRQERDAGLSLGELAQLLAALGADHAINLDGGGSATQVCAGQMVNSPREIEGTDIPGGRPVYTALTFTPSAPSGSDDSPAGSLVFA